MVGGHRLEKCEEISVMLCNTVCIIVYKLLMPCRASTNNYCCPTQLRTKLSTEIQSNSRGSEAHNRNARHLCIAFLVVLVLLSFIKQKCHQAENLPVNKLLAYLILPYLTANNDTAPPLVLQTCNITSFESGYPFCCGCLRSVPGILRRLAVLAASRKLESRSCL